MRDAGIEKANLVTVSSIFPAHCIEMSRRDGEKLIMPGQIVHCVMARQDTNEPNRLIAAAIGLARPADKQRYGYLSEHHSYGETAKKAGDYAEDLAATMLATTLGIEFDPEKAVERARAGLPPREDDPEDAQHRAERRRPRQGAVVHGHRLRRLHLLARRALGSHRGDGRVVDPRLAQDGVGVLALARRRRVRAPGSVRGVLSCSIGPQGESISKKAPRARSCSSLAELVGLEDRLEAAVVLAPEGLPLGARARREERRAASPSGPPGAGPGRARSMSARAGPRRRRTPSRTSARARRA